MRLANVRENREGEEEGEEEEMIREFSLSAIPKNSLSTKGWQIRDPSVGCRSGSTAGFFQRKGLALNAAEKDSNEDGWICETSEIVKIILLVSLR